MLLRYQHGGRVYDKSVAWDFSVNVNPLGMPQEVKQSIVDNVDYFETYPDTECLELRRKLSQVECVPFDNVVCGNGADDIIFRVSRVLNPKSVLTLSPTFSEYEHSLPSGSNVVHYPLASSKDFNVQEDVLEYLHGVDVFYLCNPNNPTGTVLDVHLMGSIVNRCIQEGVTLVVDECFLDFVVGGTSFKQYLSSGVRLIVIKAFTKIYSMAGIRLGYAICSSAELCKAVASCGQAWSVSSVAQVCGLSALGCVDYVGRTQRYVQEEREYLVSGLVGLGFKVYPSVTNYVLLQTNVDLYDILLKEKVLVRECSNYVGLDGSYYRVAIKTHEENTVLLDTLKKLLKR